MAHFGEIFTIFSCIYLWHKNRKNKKPLVFYFWNWCRQKKYCTGERQNLKKRLWQLLHPLYPRICATGKRSVIFQPESLIAHRHWGELINNLRWLSMILVLSLRSCRIFATLQRQYGNKAIAYQKTRRIIVSRILRDAYDVVHTTTNRRRFNIIAMDNLT